MEVNKKAWPISSMYGIRGAINTNPDYQRPSVWSSGQKQLLVDSILRGYDVPKFYWRQVGKKPVKFDVVDGQQRIRAICEFCDGKYGLPKNADTIDGNDVAGLKYQELPFDLRIRWDTYNLDVVVMDEADEDETRRNDPKLEKLEQALVEILNRANREGLDEQDKRNRRKVIIFSYFADTVDWVVGHLNNLLASDKRFAVYRGRLVAVTGDEIYEGVSRERAVFGFAPESSEAPPGQDEDRFDILVTTDVLAEGMNLQQCRNVINYDLPWNPMRLVQRHGRIDRIGSPHRDVYIRCYFPDVRLDNLLDLEARIRRKLAQAAASVGVEHEVIPGCATSEIVFAETREEIERLRREDPSLFVNAGEDPLAHSGEEYRQELRKGLELYGDRIASLPWGAGSGFRGGAQKGHFFCARVGERLFLKFVPWNGTAIIKDTLSCLRLIACRADTSRDLSPDLEQGAYAAWMKARKEIFNEWMFATDPANLQPRVRPALRAAANHLRKFPPPGMVQDEVDRLVESVEAPWGVRYEKPIREAMESAAGAAASAAIAEAVRRLGLEPFKAPDPLPPIEEQDIRLICWMAVDAN